MEEQQNFKIYITRSLYENVQKPDPPFPGGFLLSVPCFKKGELYVAAKVVGLNLQQLDSEIDNMFKVMPGGFEPFGLYLMCTNPKSKEEVSRQCHQQLPMHYLQEDLGGSYRVLAVDSNDMVLYSYTDQGLELDEFSVIDTNVFNDFMKIRVRGEIMMNFNQCQDREELVQNIEAQFHSMNASLNSTVTGFHFPDIHAVIAPQIWTHLDPTQPCGDLLDMIAVNAKKAKHNVQQFGEDVIQVRLLQQLTGNNGLGDSIACAPIIHHEHKTYSSVSLTIRPDALVYIHKDEDLAQLPDRLLGAVVLQLGSMCTTMSCSSNVEQVFEPEVFHFKPDELEHVATLVYSKDLDEDDLAAERQLFHTLLDIADDRPVLRRCNAVEWPEEAKPCPYLKSPHKYLAIPAGEERFIHTVQGHYHYHHYMQDGFNDDKWGCAYRSLQTIVSWFKLQGYTERVIPTHKEIQQTLVKIGDKESSIIGSRQWIGSTEVAFVLEELLKVTSKILYVSSGSELSSHSRELAMHFDYQGTPVMIGGGVLAHTILGVSFNEITGETKFLVLDPHYTGAEDLKTVIDKGWCGWKGAKFWKDNSHYNMCLPQRPNMF